MSVTLRKYQGGDDWEVDIRVLAPGGALTRERKKAPVSGRSAALRWAHERERVLLMAGKPKPAREEPKPTTIVTLREFAPRFVEGYTKANRQKPSGIAAKETVLRIHLIPHLGNKPLTNITTEDIQRLKSALARKSPKTVNNVLTVLNVTLRTAVAWNVIDRLPCVIKLLPTSRGSTAFFDFDEYE